MADVSLSSLDRIEQGACPRQSRVLAQAWAALAAYQNDHELPAKQLVGKAGNTDAHPRG